MSWFHAADYDIVSLEADATGAVYGYRSHITGMTGELFDDDQIAELPTNFRSVKQLRK